MPPKAKAPAMPSEDAIKRAKGKAMRKKSENIYSAEEGRRKSEAMRESWAKSAGIKKGKGKGKGKGAGKGKSKGKGKYVPKVSSEESRAAAVEKLERWVVKKRKESINEMVKIDKMLAPKKPKFKKVKTIQPDAKGLNLLLKCVKCDKIDDTTWEAVLGDETGVVTFSLKSEGLADLCKPGASVRVQNAKVIMTKGFIRVVIDKWAVMKAADEPVEADALESNNISGTEYELA